MTQKTQQKVAGVTNIYMKNRDSKAKVIINVGGARSSKSYSIAQLLIEKLVTEENKKIGICRKTFPALRMTTMNDLFLPLLKEYGIYNEARHNKTFNTYQYRTNNIQFFGLDEAEKIGSAEFNYIWMEEANEFTYNDYIKLKLRLSGPKKDGELNQMYLSLNPIDAENWIAKKAVNDPDVELIHSTYLDNPYLDDDYKKVLTDLIMQDENQYRIFVLGEWGKIQRRIYTNYQVLPELPDMKEAKWCYGLDFGLVNPSAVVKVYLLKDKIYLEERLYKSGLTTADIIEFFSHEERGDIYGDPSAKQMLAEIRQAGYIVYEGHKSVKEGIDLCQRQTLMIPAQSAYLIKEIQGYQWKQDKDEHILDEPIKYNDHALDAMRYAVFGITERYGFPTRRPGEVKPISTLTFKGRERNKILDRWLRKNG